MRAGRLKHRISLEKPVKKQDPDSGEIVDSWQKVADLWAEIAPASVREFVAAQATQSEVTGRIVIRYRPDITNKFRITHKGRIYNIHGVLSDPDTGLDYLTLPVSEGVKNG